MGASRLSAAGAIARFSFRHSRAVLAAGIVLSLLCLLPLRNLRPEENVLLLLPQQLSSVRALQHIRENFDIERDLLLLLEGDSPSTLLTAADLCVERLRREPLVASAHDRLDDDQHRFFFRLMPRYLLLILPDAEQREILAFLQNPEALREQIRSNRRLLQSAAPGVKERIARDPLDLFRRSRSLMQGLGAAGRVSPTEEGYFLSEDGRSILIRVRGRKPAQDLTYARDLIQRVREAIPSGFRSTLAGGYAVAVQDNEMIRRDMILSSFGSFALNLLVLWLVFRTPRSMFHIGIPLFFGLSWMVGTLAICFGRLNPLLAASTAVVAGLGIDYAIHIMSRFRHELGQGASREDAIVSAMSHLGGGVLGAAVTTIGVFLAFLTSDLQGLAEFGVACALGVALCLLSTFTVFPAILAVGRMPVKPSLQIFRPPRRGHRWILAGSVLLSLAALFSGFAGPGESFEFEPDWKNLRPAHDPAMDAQEQIGRIFWGSTDSLTAVLQGDPIAKAIRLEPVLDDLCRRGVLASYRSVTSLLPDPARQNRNRERLSNLPATDLPQGIRTILQEEGFRPEAYHDYLDGVSALLRPEGILDEECIRREKLESVLAPLLSGDTSLIQIFPASDLWEKEARNRVREEIRLAFSSVGVPCELTGFKVVTAELEELLRADFLRLLTISAGLVLLLTFLSFRNIGLTLLATLPLLIGSLFLVAIMKGTGLHVNVMNLIAFPMVLGLGIDYGIHLTHLYAHTAPEKLPELLPVSLQAVFLDALTTVLGFAALIPVENRGVASMGTVTAVGILCCAIPAFWTLPAALMMLRKRTDRPSSIR